MPFYKLPAAGVLNPPPEPAAQALPPVSADRTHPARRDALPFRQVAAGLLRLLRRAVQVRAASSARLVDEQEERQLRLLALYSSPSRSGR